ncbi:MAG: N-acetylmuramoyl-L-alanine amidase [Desulfobulbus sp.]
MAKPFPAIKDFAVSKTPQERYNDTKTKLAKLLVSKQSIHNRSNWLVTANAFGELFLENKKTDIGPSCLFMQARTYHLMHDRFHLTEDAESARKTYLEVADLYPGNILSDDALYKAASLTIFVKDKTPTVTNLYQLITHQYPQGDYFSKAQQHLAQLEPLPSKEEQLVPATQKNDPAQEMADKHENTNWVQVGQSKFWSSDQYSRVVITANSKIPYTVKQINNSLTLDLKQARIDPKFCSVQQFDKGLLQQVRTGQVEQGVVRLDLGLQPFMDYKVFTLNDPFRIIVDVYGAEKATPMQPEKPESISSMAANNLPVGNIPILTDNKKLDVTSSTPHIKMDREHLSLAQQLGLGIKTIVIDPGHGGKDPGAMAFGLKEKNIALKIAKKLARILTETFHYQVVLTRTKDVYIPLEKRTAVANVKKADLFVSIHVNAHPNHSNSGIETYFLNLATDADAMRVAALENASSTHSIGELQDILSSLMNNSKIDESSRLARFVQTNLINGLNKTYKPRDLGVKQAPFYVLIGAEMPAILAELSFITNPQEAQFLEDDKHLEKIAQQLAGGIVAYIDHHRAAVRFY